METVSHPDTRVCFRARHRGSVTKRQTVNLNLKSALRIPNLICMDFLLQTQILSLHPSPVSDFPPSPPSLFENFLLGTAMEGWVQSPIAALTMNSSLCRLTLDLLVSWTTVVTCDFHSLPQRCFAPGAGSQLPSPARQTAVPSSPCCLQSTSSPSSWWCSTLSPTSLVSSSSRHTARVRSSGFHRLNPARECARFYLVLRARVSSSPSTCLGDPQIPFCRVGLVPTSTIGQVREQLNVQKDSSARDSFTRWIADRIPRGKHFTTGLFIREVQFVSYKRIVRSAFVIQLHR